MSNEQDPDTILDWVLSHGAEGAILTDPDDEGWCFELELKPSDVNELVEQRGEEYGDAAIQTGRWIQENIDILSGAGDIVFCLIMVYSKLARAVHSPWNPDHYLDAAGYVKLAVDYLDHKAALREEQYRLDQLKGKGDSDDGQTGISVVSPGDRQQ